MLSSNKKRKQIGIEILVRGIVQGVGFRPFVYTSASRFSITGTVINTGDGVVIRAAGDSDRLESFVRTIEAEPPPLSRITSIESRAVTFDAAPEEFTILASSATDPANTGIPPDIALCRDCCNELFDPSDRRFRHPFITCTNCGPRFTIVETIPYDRPQTSMKTFPMCAECETEYHDPANRRFHAQPNSCPQCGPVISWHEQDGTQLNVQDIIAAAATSLAKGHVVAIRGLGGFHLAVNGCSAEPVSLLRRRKNRPEKPLAVMVADLTVLQQFCHVNEKEKRLLLSPEHPIVLLKKRTGAEFAPNLAPGIDDIGVMLPYTPLHHLLFAEKKCPAALVMTSGNTSGTPICTGNEDALQRLTPLADFFLLHNREIVTRVDDSVVKVTGGKPLIFRRARGFAPSPVTVPWQLPSIIGSGAELKSTFCLGRKTSAYLSQHIGDLANREAWDFYTESVDHLERLLQIEPEAVACDLHPDYMSTRFAEQLKLPLYRIQHHHAHAVAVMAEHGLDEPVLAVIMDGTGYGTDGTIWGGEILQADPTSFSRLGRLGHLHLPGGDAAATEPWRMALSALYCTYGEDGLQKSRLPAPLRSLGEIQIETIKAMMINNFNSPLTSSCGRLFDAAASLLGLCEKNSYEGQAAMELESSARKAVTESWLDKILPNQDSSCPPSILKNDRIWEISSAQFVKLVVDGLARGENSSSIALDFHLMLINTLTELIRKLSRTTAIDRVVLSGGCMQNSLLMEGLCRTLKSINLKVYTGETVPVNDGAISLGQIITGGLQHVSSNSHENN